MSIKCVTYVPERLLPFCPVCTKEGGSKEKTKSTLTLLFLKRETNGERLDAETILKRIQDMVQHDKDRFLHAVEMTKLRNSLTSGVFASLP
jgi:hypothetical protein